MILADGPAVGLADLPAQLGQPSVKVEVGGAGTLERLEREHLRLTLARSASLDEAAKTLGINPSTLYRKRKDYGL